MGGGKGDSNSVVTTRWAPYVESAHMTYLNEIHAYRAEALLERPDGEIISNPFKDYDPLLIDGAFFGAGYVLSSYPSLYDMYGKFMAGLDVEAIFDEVFEDTINGPVVDNLISAEADILSDDIEQEAAPRFEAGMRDINSVMSSSFVVGRAMMEVGRTKAISRFSADMRGKLMPIVVERWKSHLDWNRSTVEMYAQILKLYISARMDVDNHNMDIAAKHSLWPFTILEFERAALAALAGPQTTTNEVKGASKAAKAVGGALMGAASGALMGSVIPGLGTLVGAVIGGVLGLGGGLL